MYIDDDKISTINGLLNQYKFDYKPSGMMSRAVTARDLAEVVDGTAKLIADVVNELKSE